MRRLWWCWFLGAALVVAGCQSWVVPVDPYQPPGPGPSPVPPNPTPPPEPPSPTTPTITEEQFASVHEGDAVGAVLVALGKPFQSHDAAGFTIYTYVLNTGATVFLWARDGVIDHKGRAP